MTESKPDPYMIDEENPEWTAEDFKNARPASELLYEIFSKEVAENILSKNSSGISKPVFSENTGGNDGEKP